MGRWHVLFTWINTRILLNPSLNCIVKNIHKDQIGRIISTLPRSQTSLSLRKGLARKGGREGADFVFKMAECSMADDYAIFKKEHRPVRFTNFEGKVVFPHPECQEEAVFLQLNGLQHHYRIRHLAALSMPKNYRRNRLWSARTKQSCTAMMFAMYLLHTGGLLEYCRGKKTVVITVSTSNLFVKFPRKSIAREKAIHYNTGAMFDHVLKGR